MAYYNSSYYQSNNDLDPSIYNLFDYDPTPYYHAYNRSYDQYTPSWSTTCYSTFTRTESKSIVYEPNSCHVISYDQKPRTQFVTSYSVSAFNVPDFDDYDPTPYDGGYDIAQTYGKPLPPTDQICYPRSTAEITNVLTSDDKDKEREKAHDDHESQAEKTKKESKPEETVKEEEEEEEEEEEAKKELGHEENGTNYKERTEEVGGGNGYEYGNQVSQIPSGYGLEAMDLCESIFGYWPCFARYARRANNGNCHEGEYGCGYGYGYGYNYHWNGAAEYLFGSSDPYVERRDGGGSFGQPVHCYQRHYQAQPITRQDQYDHEEHSWSQNFNIF
ncbi:histone H3.v1 [Morus notabilis]|uniref:histone H3.v1 n=1 Tax=Morus notabilis TaxID=981085 RepID=UPI000CED12E3|nr:histone H3.v1 [Morus notabilis]